MSEDDQVIMQGVMNDKNAIAFVGYAYYMANRDKVRAIKVNGVLPTKDTINQVSISRYLGHYLLM